MINRFLILLFFFVSVVSCLDAQILVERKEDQNKSFSILGNSISTYPDYIPETYLTFFTTEHFGVEDTWWMRLSQQIGWKINSNKSWSGGRISYDGLWDYESYFSSYTRISKLRTETDPDYIIIEGGTNDWGWSPATNTTFGVIGDKDSTTFCGACEIMFQRLVTLYPNTQIICLGMFPRSEGMNTPCSHGWTLNEGNNVLKELSVIYNAWFIDMNKCGIDSPFELYTFDGLHPNSDGMALVANHIKLELNKYMQATGIIPASTKTEHAHYDISGRVANRAIEGIHIANGIKYIDK